MQHEADARQRRLQFMAHRGHEIGLHVVQQPKPGNVLQKDRRAERCARRNREWAGCEAETCGFFANLHHDRFVKTLGNIIPLVVQHVGQGLAQRLGRLPNGRAITRLFPATCPPASAAPPDWPIPRAVADRPPTPDRGRNRLWPGWSAAPGSTGLYAISENSRSSRAMLLKALASCPSSSSEFIGTS